MNRRAHTLKEVLQDKLLRLFMLLLVVMAVFPFVYMFILSLTEAQSMRLTFDIMRKATWTLDNYKRLFTGNGKMHIYILNSTIITVYACLVTCTVSSMAAYVFCKKRFAGRDKLYNLYLLTMMVPGHVTMIPTFIMVREMGLLGSYTGIVLPMYYAYGVVMMRSFVKGIPDELLEASEIDGCNEIQKFIRIVLPLLKPAIISLAIYTFFNVWGNLLWPMIVAGSDKMTVTQAVASYKNENYSVNYGQNMAAMASAFLPPFVLYLILQKQFVEGIAVSGIKG